MTEDRRLDPVTDVKRADSLGGINLVPGHREQIHPQFVHKGRDLAHRLGCVCVHKNALLAGQFGDVADGLDGADLVVGVHDGDQDGVGSDGGVHIGRVHQSVCIHRKDGYGKTMPLHETVHLEYSRVLDTRGDEVASFGAA